MLPTGNEAVALRLREQLELQLSALNLTRHTKEVSQITISDHFCLRAAANLDYVHCS